MISKQFAKRRKDSAVSPVIATILMVAITVVLAAVLYVMVSGFTHSPGTANSAGLNENQLSTTEWNVTVASASASNIGLSTLKIVITGGPTAIDGTYTMPTLPTTAGPGSPGSGPIAMTGTSGVVSFGELSGNSGSYLNVGDFFQITSSSSASGATVTLYSGSAQLGSTTL